MKLDHPEWMVPEIMKHVSVKWQTMSKEERKEFEDMAKNDKKRYDEALARFREHTVIIESQVILRERK